MIETVFTGEGMTPAERFEQWRQMAIDAHSPYEILTEHISDFRATMRLLDLGPVAEASFSCPPVTSVRTPKLIRQADPELLYVSIPRRGRIDVSRHDGQEVSAATGELMIMSSSLPYRGNIRSTQQPAVVDQFLLPRSLLTDLPRAASHALNLSLPTGGGLAALLTQFLTHLVDETDRYDHTDVGPLGTIAIDLVAALLTRHIDRPQPPESRPRVLALRVREFIRQNLDDPELTPAKVAAAHHISTRSLHRLFEQQETTVAAFIRRQRLERARRDLADPRLAHLTIAAIAQHAGFRYPADFTRSFKTAYGATPRTYRHEMTRAQSP
ncbi:helix-turn-helix domain-containing protein [Streptomyces sp. NPDC127098]|uniref:helix-turn-helix domain-containing protein n=1 Tax=Streptomyces sp. NPDC127098 TaxID=3347137 RepID=UPI0036563A8B